MMFSVKSDDGNILLSPIQVVQTIMPKITEEDKPDHLTVMRIFLEYLEQNSILHRISMYELGMMCFKLGYFLKVFMTNNDVTIEGINEQSSISDKDTGTSTDDCTQP